MNSIYLKELELATLHLVEVRRQVNTAHRRGWATKHKARYNLALASLENAAIAWASTLSPEP